MMQIGLEFGTLLGWMWLDFGHKLVPKFRKLGSQDEAEKSLKKQARESSRVLGNLRGANNPLDRRDWWDVFWTAPQALAPEGAWPIIDKDFSSNLANHIDFE